jgi:hypothetical protein
MNDSYSKAVLYAVSMALPEVHVSFTEIQRKAVRSIVMRSKSKKNCFPVVMMLRYFRSFASYRVVELFHRDFAIIFFLLFFSVSHYFVSHFLVLSRLIRVHCHTSNEYDKY